jgi:hypothetical protein
MLRNVLLVCLVILALALSGCCGCLPSGSGSGDDRGVNDNGLSTDDGQTTTTGSADLVGDWSDSTSGHTEYTIGDWEYTRYSALGRMIIFDKNGQFNDIVRFEGSYGGFENVQLGNYRVRGDTITFSNVQVKSTDSLDNPVWSTRKIADYTASYVITDNGDAYELALTWADGNTTTLYKNK